MLPVLEAPVEHLGHEHRRADLTNAGKGDEPLDFGGVAEGGGCRGRRTTFGVELPHVIEYEVQAFELAGELRP